MKRFVKLGLSEEQAGEFMELVTHPRGITLVAGPLGTRIEKLFRTVADMGAKAFLNDIAKAEDGTFAFLPMSLPQALAVLSRLGRKATACLSRRKAQRICPDCSIPWNPEARPAHDREDAGLLFAAFPDIDFSHARMPSGKACPECGKADAIICELAVFDSPGDPSDFLEFGKRHPEKGMARQAALLAAAGVIDPAQAARAGGLLLGSRP